MPIKPPVFRPAHQQSRKQQNEDYNRRRGSSAARGYDWGWRQAALAYRHAHPLCVGCGAVGRTVPATLVDHIVPFRGDHELQWDRANWQSSCEWHHSQVKQQLEDLYDHGRIEAASLRLDSEKAKEITLALDL